MPCCSAGLQFFKKCSAARALVFVTMLVVASSVSSWASSLVVSNSQPSCIASKVVYTTIQAAVNAASSGSKIEVCPGTYPEQVVITVPLTLTGVPGGTADNPTVVAPSSGAVANTTVTPRGTTYPTAAQLLIQNTTGVAIENLSVDGSNSGLTDCNTGIVGIYYQNASGTVKSATVQNQVGYSGCYLGYGVYVETDSGSSAVTIENNSVQFTSGLTIGAVAAGTTVTIKDNYVVGSAVSLDNAIYVAGGATGTVSGNTVINFASAPDSLGDVTDGICGIAVSRKSGNVTVSGNSIGNTEIGICLYANSNTNTITGNHIFSTPYNDGVYICSNGNKVQDNVISSSTDSGVRLDNSSANSCTGFGNNNMITKNTINGACVGVIEPSGTTGNIITPNVYSNIGATTSPSICP